MTKSSIKCVIFDCDGTLVDSESLCSRALVEVYAQYGVHISFDECMTHFQGGKLADILQQTNLRAGVSLPLDQLEPQYRQRMKQLFDQELKPIFGAEQVVQQLIERNISVCVASNGPISKMQHSLQLTGMLDYFKESMFSACDINSWKPDPDLLIYSAMQMGYLPDECLFVDDTLQGVQAGVNAGIKTLYFSVNSAQQLQHPLVTRIERLNQVADYV